MTFLLLDNDQGELWVNAFTVLSRNIVNNDGVSGERELSTMDLLLRVDCSNKLLLVSGDDSRHWWNVSSMVLILRDVVLLEVFFRILSNDAYLEGEKEEEIMAVDTSLFPLY